MGSRSCAYVASKGHDSLTKPWLRLRALPFRVCGVSRRGLTPSWRSGARGNPTRESIRQYLDDIHLLGSLSHGD